LTFPIPFQIFPARTRSIAVRSSSFPKIFRSTKKTGQTIANQFLQPDPEHFGKKVIDKTIRPPTSATSTASANAGQYPVEKTHPRKQPGGYFIGGP